jgi:O-acetylhomoserine (thiol)-lyase
VLSSAIAGPAPKIRLAWGDLAAVIHRSDSEWRRASSPSTTSTSISLETLPLRIHGQFETAAKVADFLAVHPEVARVIYPGLQTGLDRKRAGKYLKFGYGGLVGFEPKGGEKAALGFIDRLKLFYHLSNIGDARSLAIHPGSTTHGQLNPEQQAAAGISRAFVRLSIGIEDPKDIIADIAQALDGV